MFYHLIRMRSTFTDGVRRSQYIENILGLGMRSATDVF